MIADQGIEELRERLEDWISTKLPDASNVTISELQSPSGMGWSVEILFFELAYHVDSQAYQRQCVLRREVQDTPLIMGTELARQAAVMQYVANNSKLPVPEVLGLETSTELLAAPFMVMERLGGKAVQQNPNYNVHGWVSELPETSRSQPWLNGVKAIAQLHKLNADDSLAFLRQSAHGAAGLPQYLEWVKGWLEWTAQGREIEIATAALDYLFEFMPEPEKNSVLWGDATPANCLFDDNFAVSGILDWELAGMGPGEIDLAWWLFLDQLMSEGLGYPRLAGLPDRKELISCYEHTADRAVKNIEYYEILSALKMALITARSVDRYVQAGKVDLKWENNAIKCNPSTILLAKKLGSNILKDCTDFNIYIQSLFSKS